MDYKEIDNKRNRLIKAIPNLTVSERKNILSVIHSIHSVKERLSSIKTSSLLRIKLDAFLKDIETNITDFEVLALLNRQKRGL